jgi:hypothetical protein
MTYHEIYECLLERVKKEVFVYHKRLGENLDGFFDADYGYIVVRQDIRNTKRGVQVLAHEYTHFKDQKSGKFKRFFSYDKTKYSEEKMREVIRAEQSAGRGAAKICKEYGKLYEPEELNKKRLPYLIKFWRGFYFYK